MHVSLAVVFAFAALFPAQHEEQARGVRLDPPASAEEPPLTYRRRHALVVGIDSYNGSDYPELEFASADASAVAELLVDTYGFAQEDVCLLINADATHVTLKQRLEEWICDPRRVAQDDLVFIYFAGHGVTRDLPLGGKRGYLVPVDGRGGERWASLIGMNELEDISEAIPAGHALFVLDCCFGGLTITRGAQPVFAGLQHRARQVLTAGSGDQVVLDGGGGKHSVFTAALLEALRGGADETTDGIVAFGELSDYVSQQVQTKTDGRQTPLQANFPDHGGGTVAFFPPGFVPRTLSAAEQIRALEQSHEEVVRENQQLDDRIVVDDLLREAKALWPQEPSMLPAYRRWLTSAKELLTRLPVHRESMARVREEARLMQVLSGRIEQDAELRWESVDDPNLRTRHERFQKLLEVLSELEVAVEDVERRVEVASTLVQRSIDDHRAAWDQAIGALREHPAYGGLELAPQIGLVPIGPDPESGLWEFAHVLTGDLPERDAQGRIQWEEDTALVLVLIPEGSFVMGAQDADPTGQNYDPAAFDDEPLLTISVSTFFLSKLEMTQQQWARFTGENPSWFDPGQRLPGDSRVTLMHPIENVGWDTAMDTLLRIGLTLPLESSWEYATRAGTSTVWWTGNERESLVGAVNLADATARNLGLPWTDAKDWPELEDGFVIHAPAQLFRANPFGLHNVHGNVAEWVYADSWREARSETHCARGGSYRRTAGHARSANRLDDTQYVGPEVGVRPARLVYD